MAASLTPLLAHLWQKNIPLMQDRLLLLDRAAAAPDDPALRQRAIEVAHKLAGSLGMFGFPAGTELARALEQGLEDETLHPAEQLRMTCALRTALSLDSDSGRILEVPNPQGSTVVPDMQEDGQEPSPAHAPPPDRTSVAAGPVPARGRAVSGGGGEPAG